MTINQTDLTAEHELSELVACTLSDIDLKTQRQRWINVGTNFGIGREKTDEGLRLTFKNHPAVERELRSLVAVENDCCSWASWSVERNEGAFSSWPQGRRAKASRPSTECSRKRCSRRAAAGTPRRVAVLGAGAGAVTVTAFAYALEGRHRAFVALFAAGCALSSAYGFAIGSVPFGSVEALWSIIALRRFAGSGRTYPGSV